jgi:hypothetical protein
MHKHADVLRRSEALTRYALIDPLLTLVGWDVHDPERVRPEYSVGGGVVDYALLRDGKPLFFVEAKALDGNLSAGTVQNINYCLQAGTPYLVTTDGRRWTIYDTHKPVPLPEKEIVGFDLGEPDMRTILVKALFLWQPVPPIPIPTSEKPSDEPPTDVRGTIALTQLQVKPHDKVPAQLHLPNGRHIALKYWNGLFREVAQYLYDSGKLVPAVCPVEAPNSKYFLVNTVAQHKDGRKFWNPHQVGSLWVEASLTAPDSVECALTLIRHLGENPDAFRVQIS